MLDRESMTAEQLNMVDSLSEEANEEALFADGFEEAFFGVVMRAGQPAVAGYDQDKCISILLKQGMSYEEAAEYFSFNVLGAFVGENTPCFVRFVDGFTAYEPTEEELEESLPQEEVKVITESEAEIELDRRNPDEE